MHQLHKLSEQMWPQMSVSPVFSGLSLHTWLTVLFWRFFFVYAMVAFKSSKPFNGVQVEIIKKRGSVVLFSIPPTGHFSDLSPDRNSIQTSGFSVELMKVLIQQMCRSILCFVVCSELFFGCNCVSQAIKMFVYSVLLWPLGQCLFVFQSALF